MNIKELALSDEDISEIALSTYGPLPVECFDISETRRYFARAIEQAVHAKVVPEWISVSDRLPESDNLKDFYMAYTKSDGVLLLAGWFIGHEDCTATHWQALPQPPKEEA